MYVASDFLPHWSFDTRCWINMAAMYSFTFQTDCQSTRIDYRCVLWGHQYYKEEEEFIYYAVSLVDENPREWGLKRRVIFIVVLSLTGVSSGFLNRCSRDYLQLPKTDATRDEDAILESAAEGRDRCPFESLLTARKWNWPWGHYRFSVWFSMQAVLASKIRQSVWAKVTLQLNRGYIYQLTSFRLYKIERPNLISTSPLRGLCVREDIRWHKTFEK